MAVEETSSSSSGLGYNHHCSDDDGDIAAEKGGGGARALTMFVSAGAGDAAGDGAHHDNHHHDETGNDIITAFQQSMPPQHQILPPRPTIPNPFHNFISQQQLQVQQPPIITSLVQSQSPLPVAADAVPSLSPSPALAASPSESLPMQQYPKEEIIGSKDKYANPVEKARAIAMRFRQEALQPPHQEQSSSNYAAAINDTSIPNDIDYARLRHQYFQQERNKLQTFTLKNLEYIMKHQENELRNHVSLMNQMVAYEEQQDMQLLQLRREQQKQHRSTTQREQRQIMNEKGGGIGSEEQRRAERARRKRRHPIITSSNTSTSSSFHHLDSNAADADASSSSSSSSPLQHHPPGDDDDNDHTIMRTSIYLTNLPTDGSTTERTLRSLFCGCYGRLDRVTMYRHRDSGMLKGDGLIVFGRDAVEEYRRRRIQQQQQQQQQQGENNHPPHEKDQNDGNNNNNNSVVGDLVEAVCAEMNGAELPSGHVIGVQPAQTMDKKKKKKKKKWTMKTMDVHDKDYSGNDASDEAKMSFSAASTTELDRPDVSRGSNNNNNKNMQMASDAKTSNNEQDDDLDDFFASLR